MLVGAIFTGHKIPWCCLWWLAWLPSSLIPILKTDIYNHTSLCLVSPYNVSDTPILPFKNPTIFRGPFVDYGPKSIYGSKWNPFGDCQVGSMISPIINRNLQSLGYVSINSWTDQLPIWGHSEVPNRMLLPEVNNCQVLEKRVASNW